MIDPGERRRTQISASPTPTLTPASHTCRVWPLPVQWTLDQARQTQSSGQVAAAHSKWLPVTDLHNLPSKGPPGPGQHILLFWVCINSEDLLFVASALGFHSPSLSKQHSDSLLGTHLPYSRGIQVPVQDFRARSISILNTPGLKGWFRTGTFSKLMQLE